MRVVLTILFIFSSIISSLRAFAGEPFEECPSQAFLFQGNPVQVYGVDLLTGQYSLLQSDAGLPGNINGVGFSFDDRYLYGFNTTRYSVVKLDRDLKATELNVTGLPENTTFYVGDVSDMTYWLYRKNVGLYRINLDDSKPSFLEAIKVPNANVSLTLTDFAFHPDTGEMYAIDNKSGRVYHISMNDGQASLLGDSGITGTFGAGYFDVNGYYYISRNSDGEIFRLNLSDTLLPNVVAEYFSPGPSSNQNDGARCAFAPIVSMDVDWGDAPNEYKTSLSSNGPRHRFDDSLRLGREITDGEYDANVWPLSDDNDLYDDESGVTWSEDWVAGLHQSLTIEVVGNGFINAWIDWDQNGVFDATTEHVLNDLWLTSGDHIVPILIPLQAQPGETWLRVRLSSAVGLQPTGGAIDGEVEDHPLTVQRQAVSARYYPSASGWTTLAFEDQWPKKGDYDFNDVVLHYRLTETSLLDEVRRVDISIQILALGASYRSGFAVNLPGIEKSDIDENYTILTRNGRSKYEKNKIHPTLPIVTVSTDLVGDSQMDCAFINTVDSCTSTVIEETMVSVVFNANQETSAWPAFPYDPFVFGVSNYWRGPWLVDTKKESAEIHLVDVTSTLMGDPDLWQLADDDSQPEIKRFYRTTENLPWAMLFAESWRYPKEGISLIEAYPKFQQWVESSGESSKDWFLEANANADALF
jgi:LruC domain-containing protein